MSPSRRWLRMSPNMSVLFRNSIQAMPLCLTQTYNNHDRTSMLSMLLEKRKSLLEFVLAVKAAEGRQSGQGLVDLQGGGTRGGVAQHLLRRVEARPRSLDAVIHHKLLILDNMQQILCYYTTFFFRVTQGFIFLKNFYPCSQELKTFTFYCNNAAKWNKSERAHRIAFFIHFSPLNGTHLDLHQVNSGLLHKFGPFTLCVATHRRRGQLLQHEGQLHLVNELNRNQQFQFPQCFPNVYWAGTSFFFYKWKYTTKLKCHQSSVRKLFGFDKD